MLLGKNVRDMDNNPSAIVKPFHIYVNAKHKRMNKAVKNRERDKKLKKRNLPKVT